MLPERSSLLLPFLIITLLTLCAKSAIVYKLIKVTSKSYNNSIIKAIHNPVSSVYCSACCSADEICTGWKYSSEHCTLIDSTFLFPPQVGDDSIMAFVDSNRIPVSGQWSEWGPFSECMTSCGPGQSLRYRSCDNPAPAFNGIPCPGVSTYAEPCNLHKCLGKKLEFPGQIGDWGPMEICSGSHDYVASFQTRAQSPIGSGGDDVGMNEIHLMCSDGESLRSFYSEDDILGPIRQCSGGYTKASVRTEFYVGDSSGANCLKMFCEAEDQWQESFCSTWGDWLELECDPGEKICGLQTRFDFTTASMQITTINDVTIQCCSGLVIT